MSADGSFKLVSEFQPAGDQPQAIAELVGGLERGERDQVLLGVTGSGKTFTMAKVIEAVNRPTLVISHNKTLAAQLYQEFKGFFPGNAVGFFVSYYDYYQPEAYVPSTDTYIEKDSSINDEIDRMRHAATAALFQRRDVVIVASVSCIFGLGSPETYYNMLLMLEPAQEIGRRDILRQLVHMQYTRNDINLARGNFRARGDVIEIFPIYEERAVRIELFGDTVDRIDWIDPLTARSTGEAARLIVFPNSHYVTPEDQMKRAVTSIKEELEGRLKEFESNNKLLEAQRLHQRTMFDIEMMREIGYCTGIENYSRHLDGRAPGQPPATLLDYFPDDFLLFIDESHVTVPQVRGMFNGDRSRKQVLVDFGFRLPSALDNRPLNFEEFERRVRQVVYVSATPAPFELERAEGVVVEQVIRPTGLMDPEMEVRPVDGQVDDLLEEVRSRVERGERVLVTTLTKRTAEDLSEYYRELGVRCRYLHSEIETLERAKIIRELRAGDFDVLIGINLLREGLDLPEVSLVAVLDADKEGFLRSRTSLIQTAGRAARNINGKVILYADRLTDSIRGAIDETTRRRKLQSAYNEEHGITPTGIKRLLQEPLGRMAELDYADAAMVAEERALYVAGPDQSPEELIEKLEKEMFAAAEKLEFERAAELRDRVAELKKQLLGISNAEE
jgi:excinuclease ABC subunit B